MKKGISLMILVITVIILLILTGITVTTIFNYMEIADINMYAVEILNIQNGVDDYVYRFSQDSTQYPVTNDVITFNLANVPNNSRNQFDGETQNSNVITLKKIDLSLIGIEETKFGNEKSTYDVYALSEETGKVYYLGGINFDGENYYTAAESLYAKLELPDITTPNDVKIYDVIFTPSNLNYTNVPVTTIVKVPKTASINYIMTTNNKSVSDEIIVGNYRIYEINKTSANKSGNYNINVKYTIAGKTKEAVYNVDKFDNIQPDLEYEVIENEYTKEINITAIDNESGVEQIKYEMGSVNSSDYFEHYGKTVTNNKIMVGINDTITLFIKDKAGNYILRIIENA